MLHRLSPLAPQAQAPRFSHLNQHSQLVHSDALMAQGGLLIHFYTSTVDGGSRRSLSQLKELYPDLAQAGIQVAAINPFDWESQYKLAKQLDLPFSLLYDPLSKTAKAYGASWVNTFFNYRLTYLVSQEGQIAHVQKGHVDSDDLIQIIRPETNNESAILIATSL